jgi:hypothetical protein
MHKTSPTQNVTFRQHSSKFKPLVGCRRIESATWILQRWLDLGDKQGEGVVVARLHLAVLWTGLGSGVRQPTACTLLGS